MVFPYHRAKRARPTTCENVRMEEKMSCQDQSHLDRFLRERCCYIFVHKRSMSNNANARCANQPQDSADWRSPDTERNGNNQKTSVKLRRSCAGESDIEVGALKLANTEHAADYEYNDEEQEQVCKQAVNAEHDEEHGIVAAEVGQVVVDASLDLAKVLRLRQALEVEELADGLEVGEAAAESLRADALKTAA